MTTRSNLTIKGVVAVAAVSLLSTCSGHPAFAGGIACRIKAMPPAHFETAPVPEHRLVGLPLVELQKLYAKLGGRAFNPSAHYCDRGPIGFVDPRGPVPIVYFPSDADATCQAEVIEHERAHVQGWAHNHPNARVQIGPCASR